MKKGKKAMFIGMILVVAMVTVPIVSGSMGKVANGGLKEEKNVATKVIPLNKVLTKNLDGNVKISLSEDDDLHPAITRDPSGRIVVVFATQHSIMDQDLTIVYSTDGSTWTAVSNFVSEAGILQYPDIIGIPEAGDVGLSYIDPLSDYPFTFWRITDITDTGTYNGVSYVWGETEDYEENAVTYIHQLFVPMFTLHNYYISDIPGCPFLCYFLPDLSTPEEIGGMYFDGQSILRTAPASNINLATGQDYFYLLFEHYNETTGHSEIAFKKSVTDLDLLYTSGGGPGGMDKYADIEAMPWQRYLAKGDFDAKDPFAAASGSNVAVVYMSNDNAYGDYNIKCWYSSDNGDTWEESTVAGEGLVDEVYPAAYMSGDTLFCIYIKQGNLYLVKSEDGGATWGEPEQVNDQDGTVVAEPRATDITDAGIVWVDNRNGNQDIYYAPLPSAILNVESISGGMGIKATVTNTGTEDATGVAWSIDVSGLVFVGGHTEGTVDVPAGGEATISSGLVFGIGPGTITVTVGGVTKTASCFILGPLVLGVK